MGKAREFGLDYTDEQKTINRGHVAGLTHVIEYSAYENAIKALEHIYTRVNEIKIIKPDIVMDDDLTLVIEEISKHRDLVKNKGNIKTN